jgi:hopene-associated glycosyltransferase HpnB
VTAQFIAIAASGIWLYLIFARGFFWRGSERDDWLVSSGASEPSEWPSVAVVVPARNEAEVIGRSLASLLRQTYRGSLAVIIVDDQSADGTAEAARKRAAELGAQGIVTVLRGTNVPPGWTGKLWAMEQGFRRIRAPADFILFTDADIAYEAPDTIERLVQGSLARGTVLTSLMVMLRCRSFAERALVPAFIFFFQKLYPFAWVNDPRRRIAAAAGGVMLVKTEAFVAAGGLNAIRGALIDDCALAALLKRQGPIWLGLTDRVMSLRPYPQLSDFRRMVVRSAFAELRYSSLRLLGTVVGMGLTYLAPPLLVIFAEGAARALGAVAWLAMVFAYLPTLRLYRRSPLWGLALPAIAALYTVFTLESAIRYWQGQGGEWKGRLQARQASPKAMAVR